MARTELAKAFAEALKRAGLGGPGCTRCGGLHRRSQSAVIVTYGQKPATCASCGLTLDRRGRPVGRRRADGTVAIMVYELPVYPEHLERLGA